MTTKGKLNGEEAGTDEHEKIRSLQFALAMHCAGGDWTTVSWGKKIPLCIPKMATSWSGPEVTNNYLTLCGFTGKFIYFAFVFFFSPSIKRLPSLAEFQRNKEGTQVTVHFKAANVSDVQGREVGNFIRSALKHPNSITLTSGTSNTSCSKGAPRAEKANMLQRQES